MSAETTATPAAQIAGAAARPLPAGPRLATTMVLRVLPEVQRCLGRWAAAARSCPDPVLRAQALASIRAKRFHCQGGAALALLAGPQWREAVRFIVALQTISDYLDNLCDRAGQHEAAALLQLHAAMVDAARAEPAPGCGRAYYALYPPYDDGGYLARLVGECSAIVRSWRLPAGVTAAGAGLASLYGEMQARKHAPPGIRAGLLAGWCRETGPTTPLMDAAGAGARGLLWNEFGAACGSTLGIFALYSDAARSAAADGAPSGQGPDGFPDSARRLLAAYFPWISGLHILLDYLIDRREDIEGGDLNFTAQYAGPEELRSRLVWFVHRAAGAAGGLPDGGFHRSLVDGLLGVYLSDPKARRDPGGCLVPDLLRAAGPGARVMHAACRVVRWTRVGGR